MNKDTLKDLFASDLQYLYHAEKEVAKAMPLMSRAAITPELRSAFKEHEEESRTHVERIEKIFGHMGLRPKSRRSRGIGGLIGEGKELIDKGGKLEPGVMDVALIAAVKRLKHYEIAAYDTLETYARLLGDKKSSQLLKKTLREENKTDKKLTRLAVKRADPEVPSI